MQVCDSCGRIVEFLQNTSIYIGLKNGDWAAINAELCPRCKKKLQTTSGLAIGLAAGLAKS